VRNGRATSHPETTRSREHSPRTGCFLVHQLSTCIATNPVEVSAPFIESGVISDPSGLGAYAAPSKIDADDPSCALPQGARDAFLAMIASIKALDEQIVLLDREIAQRAKEDPAARRLMTIPGIGPITATAILALAPPAESFRKGRDFAAWLGLTPRQHSTGGKQKLGAISTMGERTLTLDTSRRQLKRGAGMAGQRPSSGSSISSLLRSRRPTSGRSGLRKSILMRCKSPAARISARAMRSSSPASALSRRSSLAM
jgi:hypothetical protein